MPPRVSGRKSVRSQGASTCGEPRPPGGSGPGSEGLRNPGTNPPLPATAETTYDATAGSMIGLLTV